MKNFAVIGNPIKHSLSPILHRWVYKALNLDAKYIKIKISANSLSDFIKNINKNNLDGINITLPFKISSMEYVDVINPRAKIIGSINHIDINNRKIIGNNTDWYGFILALKNNKIDIVGKEVTVLGYGGVSRAVIFALKHLGAKKINLFNRSYDKIAFLNDNLIYSHKLSQLEKIINNDSIIINCTSCGMLTNESLIKPNFINEKQTIIDTIYIPTKTKLVLDAEKMGAKTINGLDMFIYQALISIDLWFGEPISSKVNFIDLKTYLESKIC